MHCKKGRSILIRQAVVDDAADLLKVKLRYLKKTTTLPLYDYEYPATISEEQELIERYQAESNSLLLIALEGEKMIGNVDLTAGIRKKVHHTAMIGMGIHPKWQNRGIGTLLLGNALEWAKHNDELRTIWLEAYASNTIGIALYKKLGFEPCGMIPNFFKEKRQYIDKIIMSTTVS